MTDLTPAMAASQASWRCVQSHDRAGWLASMADDVVIEDPIGQSITNPDGLGVRGKEAVSAFYDSHIALNNLTVTCEETFPSSSPTRSPTLGAAQRVRGRVHQHRTGCSATASTTTGKSPTCAATGTWKACSSASVAESPMQGRGAVVVGGSHGIGAAVAALLADLGAGVVVNGRDGGLRGRDGTPSPPRAAARSACPALRADEGLAEALMMLCENEFGAGRRPGQPGGHRRTTRILDLIVTPEEFSALLEVHLGTVFSTCRAAAPRMAAAGVGSIVNTSSFAFLGDYGGTGYPAGKEERSTA